MSKVAKYIMMLSVVILLFHFAGLIPADTPSSYLLGTLGLTNPENLESTGFVDSLTSTMSFSGVALLAAITALAIFIATRTSPIYLANYVITGFLLLIGWDIIKIYEVLKNSFGLAAAAGNALSMLIISPLLLVYILAVYDWWRSSGET